MTEANHKASGRRMSEAGLPHNLRIAVVSTRRAQPSFDTIAGNLLAKYVLFDMLTSVKAPLTELSTAHVVVLEIPSVMAAKLEQNLLSLVQKMLAMNIVVLAIVQPSLRRKNDRSVWLHRWNHSRHTPFKFSQTCSCKCGDPVAKCCPYRLVDRYQL